MIHPSRQANPRCHSSLSEGLLKWTHVDHKKQSKTENSLEVSINPLRDVDRLNEFTEHVNYSWANPLKPKKNMQHSCSSNEAEEESLTVIFLHGTNRREKHIYSSSSVKSLLRDYAEERGSQLSSLQFSLNGTILFLSSLGSMTVKDLNLTNHNEITVTSIQDSSSETSTEPAKLTNQSSEGTKKGSRNEKKTHKEQNKCKSKPTIIALVENDDKFKEAHSIELSKIFKEAETLFKGIRQKLNNLTLERTRPKTELSSTDRSSKTSSASEDHNPNYLEQGGKAGKSSYTINVGQVENLYKSSKRKYSLTKCSNQRPCIDLHGLTSDEAIERLDKAMIGWVETAMKGEYPWVIPVDIVCGGGNQILSETVKTWIKSKTNVANAPRCSS
eukprot:scaffold1462_cov64-Cyclotella_meneghiniana.AAC.12